MLSKKISSSVSTLLGGLLAGAPVKLLLVASKRKVQEEFTSSKRTRFIHRDFKMWVKPSDWMVK